MQLKGEFGRIHSAAVRVIYAPTESGTNDGSKVPKLQSRHWQT